MTNTKTNSKNLNNHKKIAAKFKKCEEKRELFEDIEKDCDYDKLEYVSCHVDDEKRKYYLFKYDKNISFYFDDESQEWGKIEKITISSTGIESSSEEFVIPKVTSTDENLVFEFYYLQSMLPYLGILNIDKKKIDFDIDCKDKDEYIIDKIKIIIEDHKEEGEFYKIYKRDKLIAEIYDKYDCYQPGDGGTVVYSYCNNDIIIENVGDVSSVVIIKNIIDN